MIIKVTNKIEDKIREYQGKTGATRTWIAKQLGMSSQTMYAMFKATNPTIETLIRFSILLDCDVNDLFEYETVD